MMPARVLLILAAILGSTASHGAMINGLDWKQPDQFKNISGNDLAPLCQASNNYVCSGNVRGTSVDGLVWASIFDVKAMLTALIPGIADVSPDPMDPLFDYAFSRSDAIGNAIGDNAMGFRRTGDFLVMDRIIASTRLTPDGNMYRTWLDDYIDPFAAEPDRAYSDIVGSEFASRSAGIWFYEAPVPVPLPAAAWLLLSGLGAVGAFARKGRAA